MDPFHLGITVEVAEAMSFIGNRIVIKKRFQSYALDIKDPAKKLKELDHLPGQPHAFSDLSRKRAPSPWPFPLREVPASPAKQCVRSFLVNMGVEVGRTGIIYNDKVPVYLCKIG